MTCGRISFISSQNVILGNCWKLSLAKLIHYVLKKKMIMINLTYRSSRLCHTCADLESFFRGVQI